MRHLFNIFLVLSFGPLFGQNGIIGNYQDYFGNSIKLNQDSTFRYEWHFDLMSSWTTGEFEIQNDTIYFIHKAKFDTVLNVDGSYYMKPSMDSISNSISEEDYQPEIYLVSGGENRVQMPSKLYYKKNKLYHIYPNGKLNKNKIRGILNRNKHRTYYIRKE